MIQIYCGDGKGKTTAAIGQAVRASGRGMKALVFRFLKTDDSGEVEALKHLPGITVIPCERSFGFTFQMTEEVRKEAGLYYEEKLHRAAEEISGGSWDMVVLDEIIGTVHAGLVKEKHLLEILEQLQKTGVGTELVLTGRNPSLKLLELADYVSEIRAVKHPYVEKGIGARKGIEY